MRFPSPISVQELATRFGAKLIGDKDQFAHGINEIHKVEPGDITFVDVVKYYKTSLSSAATIIIIDKEVDCPEGKTLLVVKHPFNVYNEIVKEHRPFRPLSEMISSSARIHPSAIIEPNVMIGHEVEIGKDSYIKGNVYIGDFTRIGERVVIEAGSVIGTEAFYYKTRAEGHEKWCNGGDVIIEDDVCIGALCTVNKGVSGSTIIGEGTKLDSQVHVGHGAVLGKHCLIAGQVAIGGKTIIGNHVKVYGQVGFVNSISVGDGAVILAKAAVMNSLEGGKTYFGIPAEESRQKYRELVTLRALTKKKQK